MSRPAAAGPRDARGRRTIAGSRAAAALLVLAVGVAGPARAQGTLDAGTARVTLAPGRAHLGEAVLYRGRLVIPHGPARVRWLQPETDPDLTWEAPRVWQVAPRAGASETLFVETRVQAFRLGAITIPGLRYQDLDPAHPGERRLPQITLMVIPVLTAADSNASLHPPRGPLAAPWWERVPWRWVLLALALLALVIVAIRAWRARRRKAAAPAAPVLDPAARARAELAALRARHLPEQGRFDAHALELSHLLRRYLEAATAAPRPGHTTPELVVVLARTALGAERTARLAPLLAAWDRLKFARAASSVEEARRSEQEVETLVGELSVPPAPPVGRAA